MTRRSATGVDRAHTASRPGARRRGRAGVRSAARASAALLLAGLATGCGSNDDVATPTGGRPVERDSFRLELSGLGDPSPFHYEIWFVISGAPQSGGRFRIDGDGSLTDLAGGVIPEGVLKAPTGLETGNASQIFVTLEPIDDSDPAPSATRILGGAMAGGTADLTVEHAAGLGVSFGGAGGQYILDTPTTAEVADFNRGIAFAGLDLSGGVTPIPGLELPELPAQGWTYEGWVWTAESSGGVPYSTGRFGAAEGFDSDRAGATAGTFGADENADGRGDGYPLPSQDFVDTAGAILPLILDLGGLEAGITVEPVPDNAATPFFLRPLQTEIPAANSVVHLDVQGLRSTGEGHFTAWARFFTGATQPIGRFLLDETGALLDLNGQPLEAFVAPGDLLLASRIFVTVEETGENGNTPSRRTVLDGALEDSTATLASKVIFADTTTIFGDPNRFRGSYCLNTFTTADTGDWNRGLWYLRISLNEGDPDTAGLFLPTLRDGWQYQGWVERLSTHELYSTGTFLSTSDSDDDYAGLTADTLGIDLNEDGHADGPGFPGQEYILPAPGVPAPFELGGGDFRAFVTIEPRPDVDAAVAFPLTVVETDLLLGTARLELHDLTTSPITAPAATVRISRGPQARALANDAAGFPTGHVTLGGGD